MSQPKVTLIATELSESRRRGALQDEGRIHRRRTRDSRTVRTLRDDAKSLASDGDQPSPMTSSQTTAQGRMYHSSPYGDPPSPMTSGQTMAPRGVHRSPPYGQRPTRSTFPLRVISPAERLSRLQMSARLAARAAASPTTPDIFPLRRPTY